MDKAGEQFKAMMCRAQNHFVNDPLAVDGLSFRWAARFAFSELPQWIPVSERLPETPGLYVCASTAGNHFVAEWPPKYTDWSKSVIAYLPFEKYDPAPAEVSE
jgi:hypothetical protein